MNQPLSVTGRFPLRPGVAADVSRRTLIAPKTAPTDVGGYAALKPPGLAWLRSGQAGRLSYGRAALRRVAGVAACLVFSAALNPAPLSAASSLSDETLAGLQFEQKLNAQVSLDLVFRDEGGRPVKLGDYFGRKPVILVLGYYGCPMLCTLVLNGMVDTLLDLKMDIGNQFEVVNVSIDPTERPELAAAKKRTYLRRYGRHGAEAGWHFLTGEESSIKKLAGEVGFQYAYDPILKQYAHPSGLIVLTPQGKVARYFFGINYPAQDLATTLREAGSEKVGSPVRQLLLLCFHYSPLRGKYGQAIITILRTGGVATVLGLAGTILLVRQHRKRRGDGSKQPSPLTPLPSDGRGGPLRREREKRSRPESFSCGRENEVSGDARRVREASGMFAESETGGSP
jgi:protein SCO1